VAVTTEIGIAVAGSGDEAEVTVDGEEVEAAAGGQGVGVISEGGLHLQKKGLLLKSQRKASGTTRLPRQHRLKALRIYRTG